LKITKRLKENSHAMYKIIIIINNRLFILQRRIEIREPGYRL
jgi:hypothetical protein